MVSFSFSLSHSPTSKSGARTSCICTHRIHITSLPACLFGRSICMCVRPQNPIWLDVQSAPFFLLLFLFTSSWLCLRVSFMKWNEMKFLQRGLIGIYTLQSVLLLVCQCHTECMHQQDTDLRLLLQQNLCDCGSNSGSSTCSFIPIKLDSMVT